MKKQLEFLQDVYGQMIDLRAKTAEQAILKNLLAGKFFTGRSCAATIGSEDLASNIRNIRKEIGDVKQIGRGNFKYLKTAETKGKTRYGDCVFGKYYFTAEGLLHAQTIYNSEGVRLSAIEENDARVKSQEEYKEKIVQQYLETGV